MRVEDLFSSFACRCRPPRLRLSFSPQERCSKHRILVAEDEAPIRNGIVAAFQDNGYDVTPAADGREAMDLLDGHSYDLVISDYRMPGPDGLEVLRHARRLNEDAVVIMMTAYGTVDHAVEVMREGAYDYVQKPFSLEDLEFKVNKALEHLRLRGQVRYLEQRFKEDLQSGNMVGRSGAIREILKMVRKVAPSSAAILIQGETGTGKELIAEAIHQNSNRHDAAFVKMNCAALPENLLESELFGHEKGAFTGADRQRIGRFELASSGTLFLDEIGNMSQGIQAKVLRVIQEQEFERVGGAQTIKVDVRLVAATNRDLASAMAQGLFREDLYYRLNVVNILVPPLRERKEDIQPLAEHFIARYAAEINKPIEGISSEALRILLRHNWPGNIRELQNTIERAVLMTESSRIVQEDLAMLGRAPGLQADGALPVHLPPQGMNLEQIEKEVLLEALRMSNWVQKEAASLLSISSRAMNYKVRKFGITHPSWKKNRTVEPALVEADPNGLGTPITNR
ncbi:MAG: sigma-54-dependent transcriptional regulator [Acidobacteriota bacterium]